jgi:peptidoglycan/LPS O-acetylase OafA/YrhL
MKAINSSKLHIAFNVSNAGYYFLVFLTLACLCGLCESNYRLIEVPLRNIGRRIADRQFSRARNSIEAGKIEVARE